MNSLSGLVIALNFIVLFVLTLSMIYWKHLEEEEVLKCTEITCLSSYFTAIMTDIPNYYSEKDLREHLERHYGSVHAIYTPKDYGDDFMHFKEMHSLLEEFKQEREVYLRNREQRSCLPLV